jgi:hypothetical protein
MRRAPSIVAVPPRARPIRVVERRAVGAAIVAIDPLAPPIRFL